MLFNRTQSRPLNRYALLALPLLAGGCAGNNPGSLQEANAQRVYTSPIIYPDGTKIPCEKLKTPQKVICVEPNGRAPWNADSEGAGQQRLAKAVWEGGEVVASGAAQGTLLGFETRVTTSAAAQVAAAGAGVTNNILAKDGSCVAVNGSDCSALTVGTAGKITTQTGFNTFSSPAP